MEATPPPASRDSGLPSLVRLPDTAPPPTPPPTRIVERGGPWDSTPLDPIYFPALQTTLPMTLVFRKGPNGWKQHLLIAESALLRRAGAPPGLGVYAMRRFRGPREVTVPRARLVPGDEIGHYGGTVVATAPSQRQADAMSNRLVMQGAQYLLIMRVHGHPGWQVVDGSQQPVLPLMHRVNDSHGTPLRPRCIVSETGLFTADRDITALDLTRPLRDQALSELSFDYREHYWNIHDRLASESLPLDVGAALERLHM